MHPHTIQFGFDWSSLLDFVKLIVISWLAGHHGGIQAVKNGTGNGLNI